jgi:hypothetical protein
MSKVAAIILILFWASAVTAQSVQEREHSVSAKPTQSQYTDTNDARADLTKMQTLLGQMQRNVAFVSEGDTPLKHQFQLEIEMWQLLLRDMEKKLNAQQATPAK